VVSLLLAVLSAGIYAQVRASTSKGNLATITGAVTDNKGNPVFGSADDFCSRLAHREITAPVPDFLCYQ